MRYIDSNYDKENQNLLCYRYTISQFTTKIKKNKINLEIKKVIAYICFLLLF